MNSMFDLLRPQLDLVSQCLNEETNMRGRLLAGFSWPVLNQLEQNLLPSLVLLSARSQGYLRSRAIYLAAVLQFIFLASLTHSDVKQQAGPRILIGDYFYACFFNLLCRGNIIEFIEPLSNLICDINLDAARKLGTNTEEAVNIGNIDCSNTFNDREYLALAATALGSRLGKTNPREAMLWQEIGQYLGKLWNGQAEPAKAARVLERLAHGPVKDMLGDLVLHLTVKSPLRRVIAL